jgi:tetratricopeptide (TPR) repeat protein
LAIILEKEGHSNEAHDFYADALKEKPTEARIYHNLGINMKRAGNLEGALTYYKNAMDLEPANSVFLYNTGVLYNITSQYGDAIDVLEKSISNNRENVYAYLALGDAFEKKNEHQKALYVYRDLVSLGVNVQGI